MLLLQQVAAILDNAHASGLWHGGLNPRNVFVGPAGEVRIADLFGFPLDPDELMGNPAVVNELAYIAPEQWMGCAAGAASDQFALAVMAFRMLSGSLPFEAKSADRMMDLASQFDPLPLHRVNAGISVHASTVFRRAFSRRPADRYPSCMALTESILTAIEQGPDGRNCF
jgi:serine/threonine-protein kinase